jgi:Cu2+-exporting ATPase
MSHDSDKHGRHIEQAWDQQAEFPQHTGAHEGHDIEHGAADTIGHGSEHSSHGSHAGHGGHAEAAGHKPGHGAHADHTGHEQMFRTRFWVSLVLSIPVLLYSPMIQKWFGFTMPQFPGSQWVTPLFATIVFAYGGLPFLRMAVPEIRNRRPGMMTLISLAIGVAFVYSWAALIIAPGTGFFWELVL